MQQQFATHFAIVPDPRADNTRHDLLEVLFIAFVAVLCGARFCTEMAEFGRAKEDFLRRFLVLQHGIPSHDIFTDIFRRVDPSKLEEAFRNFMVEIAKAVAQATGSDNSVIAVDGKALKRAYKKGQRSAPG